MKKVIASLILLVALFVLSPVGQAASASTSSDSNIQNAVVTSVEGKISERVSKGFNEFNGLKVGKQISLLDENNQATKTLVELVNSNNQLSGYMIVDHTQNFEVVEFALGNVHPLQSTTSNNVYYLGPLAYAESVGNNMKDVKTNTLFEKNKLQEVKKVKLEKLKATNNEMNVSAINTKSATSTKTNYSYKLLSDVPDYQQSANTSMNNDCVPTSAANVLMYWRNKGYTNISPSNSWIEVANRIGVIMGHSNTNGVSRSKIVPGLVTFLTEKGYASSFNVSRDYDPTFAEMKDLINAGNPSMMSANNWMNSSGGHNITLVGYEEYYDTTTSKWSRYVIVRDNWESTPKDVWFAFASQDIDDIYKLEKK